PFPFPGSGFHRAAISAKSWRILESSIRRVSDMTRSRGIKTILLGSSLAISVLLAGAPFAAGDEQANDHNVVRKLDASEVKARSYRVADLFGESDEDKQARLQKEQSQDSQIATAQQKIDDLENSLRRLTGQLEQQDHKIGELNSRIERMQKDF